MEIKVTETGIKEILLGKPGITKSVLKDTPYLRNDVAPGLYYNSNLGITILAVKRLAVSETEDGAYVDLTVHRPPPVRTGERFGGLVYSDDGAHLNPGQTRTVYMGGKKIEIAVER